MDQNADYTQLMRHSTRKIQSKCDTIINARLAYEREFSNTVWLDCLIIFYEVFKFIERAIVETSNEHLKQFHMVEIFRTKAFEVDLNFYLGPVWNKNDFRIDFKNNYIYGKCNREYLNYLEKLERNEPELLIAYFYHLYMCLLSGTQTLQIKRPIFRISNQTEGNAISEFSEPISELKTKLRTLTNKVCGEMNPEMRDKVIKEGQMVLTLNNEILATIIPTHFISYLSSIYAQY
ncbi:heme oxygenase-like isoform X2 [Chrysoperla carnea]|uniref:heme oxygenase-like isoform X2 n=1 Tax=Chrysoperla carnea TaxID=189513 RepID=UPI001D088D95|nr:heme oxygenase-like isoform X2 [Chrysoperla carnea]